MSWIASRADGRAPSSGPNGPDTVSSFVVIVTVSTPLSQGPLPHRPSDTPLEHGHVIRRRDGQQHPGLVLVEYLRRAGLQGAVDPHPGPLGAPHHGALLGFLQAGEHLTGPEVAAHVLHRPFDLGLVLR